MIIIIKENRDRGEFGGKLNSLGFRKVVNLLMKVFVGCDCNN